MDFLKKHYEKVLLGIVLVGLAVGTAFLPVMISNERTGLDETRLRINRPKVDPLKELDLARQKELFKRTEAAMRLDFSRGHKLFNPVPWGKKPDGGIIKMEEGNVGPRAVTVTKISPLFTTVSFDSVTVTDSGARYVVGVQREAAPVVAQRSKKQFYATLNVKNDAFVIRGIKGTPEDPTDLVMELNDTSETVTVAKDHPFKREDGYVADLKYDPEKKTWPGRRIGAQISFGGEDYIIVAISRDEVVLSAKSNNKKTPIPYNPAADSK